ncbi:hypothetical protein ACWGKS_21895 [Nocardiopsis sp. NPDC055879]
MIGSGPAVANEIGQEETDPNTAPSSQPAAGPEARVANGSRPESGTDFEVGPHGEQNSEGVWIVNTPQVKLSNTVTDADGDEANLTFEAWEADSNGNPETKVSISDTEFGVQVSDFVESGSVASVAVPPGKLDPNVEYLFRTSAYDGSLYETDWSGWEPFRVELPVDLTLPAPDFDSPAPSWFDVDPADEHTKPLGASTTSSSGSTETEQCGPVNDSGQVCLGPMLTELPDTEMAESTDPLSSEDLSAQATVEIPEAEWCDTLEMGILSDRFTQCDRRIRQIIFYDTDETPIHDTYFAFTRRLVLDGTDSFSEYLTVKPYEPVSDEFGEISMGIDGHECGEGCTPEEPNRSDWNVEPSWKPGDTHPAWVKTIHEWDASGSNQEYIFQPDVTIGMSVTGPDGFLVPSLNTFPWSEEDRHQAEELDHIRCDTKGSGSSVNGCVFLNAAPTYPFNAANYPQAAAHAWLIQSMSPNQPGSRAAENPLYYMGDKDQNSRNRSRICGEPGWAADNGHASALDDAEDQLNCDEFSFASSYNSGGMAESEGGLNEAVPADSTTGTPNGRACIQTFAKEHEGRVHLYNIDGLFPEFTEFCGRSAISGNQNQGSMNRFPVFREEMRLMDGDAYWLDPRMDGNCTYTTDWGTPADPVICTMTTT